MSCTTDVCGVGNWSGPRPGDPDNNAVLSANGVFGGIEVSWTYPNTNSHAVAHTLLYRSIGDRFETAIQTAIVSGNQFFDRNTTDPIRTYYYWIRFVSINGTLMEPIGPATGYALDDLDRVIEGMAGKIEAGFLATSLRSRIDKIADLEVGVTNLSQTITDESGILSQTLLGVQSDIDATLAYYEEEREARLLADGALASAINTTVAQAKNELYAAVQESTDAQALVNGDLSAKYSVKVDLAGNVAGFGLASSGNVYDETIHSEFGVQADSFWVSGPSTVSATEPLTNLYHGRVWVDTSNAQNPVTKYYNKTTALWQTTVVKGSVPFIVKTTEDPVTGAPAGVYIDSAYISSITANRIDARGLVIRDTPENGGGILFGAGTALDWGKIGGSAKPADGATSGSNLVKKSVFSDGSAGSWNAGGVSATAHGGVGEIHCVGRDTLEMGNDFAVTPGETLFFGADIWTGLSGYPATIGVMVTNSAGVAIAFQGATALPAGQDWTRVTGAGVIPTGAVKATPWLQIDGPGGQTLPYVAFSKIYVGRQQEGATVGATAGVNLKDSSGNTLADAAIKNTAIATGQNLIPNSDWASARTIGGVYNPDGADLSDRYLAYASDAWSNTYVLQGTSTRNVFIHQQGKTASGDGGIACDTYPTGDWAAAIPVIAGKRYCFSYYGASHRCSFGLYIEFRDAGNNYISSTQDSQSSTENNADRLSLYKRPFACLTAPANASTVRLAIRKNNTYSFATDSWLWIAAPQLEIIGDDANGPGPYTPGPAINTRQLGYTGDLDATKGMLSSEASSAYTASNGWSINKNGTFTAKGGGNTIQVTTNNALIQFNKPDGSAAFAVDNTGNAIFAGTLMGAKGEFSGSLSAGVVDLNTLVGESHPYAAPGTYSLTVPIGKTSVKVIALGAGGGGGGGSASFGNVGGGGGSGGIVKTSFSRTAGETITIVIRSGGGGGAIADGPYSSNFDGLAGGASTVSINGSVVVNAGGGKGGQGGGGSISLGAGGSGGSPGGSAGLPGQFVYQDNGEMDMSVSGGGKGGSTIYGSGGLGGNVANYNSGATNGSGHGSGGGGGGCMFNWDGRYGTNSNFAGGSGAPGYVIVEFYNPNSVVLRQELVDKGIL